MAEIVFCCVCNNACEEDPIEPGKRWSWGPDGMHCHCECEAEFVRRFPELAPKDHQPIGAQRHG
jgi:hypothetical protein